MHVLSHKVESGERVQRRYSTVQYITLRKSGGVEIKLLETLEYTKIRSNEIYLCEFNTFSWESESKDSKLIYFLSPSLSDDVFMYFRKLDKLEK